MSAHALVAVVLWGSVALPVGIHASSKGRSGAFWALATLFTGFVGLVVYLIVLVTDDGDETPDNVRTCPACGATHAESPNYCSDCGEPLDNDAEVQVARILRSGSRGYCSNCKGRVDLDADACRHCESTF